MKVYYDMDGVLVDLYGSMKKMLGKKRIEFNMNFDRHKWFEDDLVEFTDKGGFFEAEAMPKFTELERQANRLFCLGEANKNVRPAILTSHGSFYSKSEEVVHQKREWLRTRSPHVFAMMEFNATPSGGAKAKFAKSEEVRNILIDDTHANIDKFIKKGGIGIWYDTDVHCSVTWSIEEWVTE